MIYVVLMEQSSYFYMEVEADDEQKARERALMHARDGERVAIDDDREWGDFDAIEAEPKKP